MKSTEKRYCEQCDKHTYCEEVPLMGYSKWFCESCFNWLTSIGEIA